MDSHKLFLFMFLLLQPRLSWLTYIDFFSLQVIDKVQEEKSRTGIVLLNMTFAFTEICFEFSEVLISSQSRH